jgi:hypothetical protein
VESGGDVRQLLQGRYASIALWFCTACGAVLTVVSVLVEPDRVFPLLSAGLVLFVSGVVAYAAHELRSPPRREQTTLS